MAFQIKSPESVGLCVKRSAAQDIQHAPGEAYTEFSYNSADKMYGMRKYIIFMVIGSFGLFKCCCKVVDR